MRMWILSGGKLMTAPARKRVWNNYRQLALYAKRLLVYILVIMSGVLPRAETAKALAGYPSKTTVFYQGEQPLIL